MTNKRGIFTELTEGFDALKSEREGKLTLRTFKAESKPAPVLLPQDVRHVREQLRLSSPVFAHYLRDNLLLSWMHSRLFMGFLLRLPWLIARRIKEV